MERPISEVDEEEFLWQFCFVVLASYWKAQYAMKLLERFWDTKDLEIIHNAHKRNAIAQAIQKYPEWLRWIKYYAEKMDKPGDGYAYTLTYIDSLPMMGPVTKYHLARNLGLDCVKPDRHLVRLAERFGYPMPLAMCQDIQREVGGSEKLGTIDLVLWWWCNLHGSET